MTKTADDPAIPDDASRSTVSPDPHGPGRADHGRDFELMLARIVHRHGKGLDLTRTIADARDLLARKGSLSPFRDGPSPRD